MICCLLYDLGDCGVFDIIAEKGTDEASPADDLAIARLIGIC